MVSRKMGRHWFTEKGMGKYQECGRKSAQFFQQRKYPKCVPLAKATQMSKLRKRRVLSKENELQVTLGPKPTFVKTLN
jgi:hypothetical protein